MNNKDASRIQEHAIADALGWQVTSGSGARAFYPGDVMSSEWLGECKTHLSVTPVVFYWSVWNKIADEAMSQFKRPVLFVDNGTQSLAKTWCMTNTKLDHSLEIHVLPADCIRKHSIKISSALRSDCIYQVADREIFVIPFALFKELLS